MAVPTTSGTVSQSIFTVRKLIDHAARRAQIKPEKITGEYLDVALDLLSSLTSEYINAGFPLWTKQFSILSAALGSPDVATPNGTVDCFHAFWRILQPWRGNATTSGGASANQLFSGAAGADLAIAGPNPAVIVNFGAPTELDTIGVLLGTTTALTAGLQVYTSPDGAAWTLFQTLPSTTFQPMAWSYFDLDPVVVSSQYVKLVAPISGSWTLNQLNFGLANGVDIELGQVGADDYYNLPDKLMVDTQPNTVFIDRTYPFPTLRIWPTLNAQGFYNGCVTAVTRRYIQDPGSLTNALEVPQRWYETMIWKLAKGLYYEIPPIEGDQQQASYFSMIARQQLLQNIEQAITKSEALMWAEERTRGPIRIAPNISAYTA